MKLALQILSLYLLLLNVITFFCYGIDKRKAKKSAWRIPERTLILLAFFGGALGALLAMKCFHHKTQHKKFTILVPLFFILHITIFGYFVYLQWHNLLAMF